MPATATGRGPVVVARSWLGRGPGRNLRVMGTMSIRTASLHGPSVWNTGLMTDRSPFQALQAFWPIAWTVASRLATSQTLKA